VARRADAVAALTHAFARLAMIGKIRRSGVFEPTRPFAASFTVPSPPKATTTS